MPADYCAIARLLEGQSIPRRERCQVWHEVLIEPVDHGRQKIDDLHPSNAVGGKCFSNSYSILRGTDEAE